MANLLFNVCVASYRIDIFNKLHKELDCDFYFLNKEVQSQKFDMQALYNQCNFDANILKTLTIFDKNQKFCTNIWSILHREKPKVVFVPEFKILTVQVLIYKWIFRKKFKVISVCDDSWDMVANDHDFSKAHKIMRKLISPYLDNLLLVDDRVVAWYKKKFGKGIWLPIIRDEKKEIKQYERVMPLSKEYIKKFDLKDKKVLLYVGRLVPIKNLERLIEAIAKTKEDFVTILVGSGELESDLKEKSSRIDKPIIFAGRYEGDGVKAWYNVADVFILPSYLEPFGAVTNEALIGGCECLVSKNAGSASLINETNGKTFNPYDTEEMAKAIDKTMKNIHPKSEIKTRPSQMSILFGDTMKRVLNELECNVE